MKVRPLDVWIQKIMDFPKLATKIIEDKRYYVDDPICAGLSIQGKGVKRPITLRGIPGEYYWQMRFIPDEFDQYVENESHEALKRAKILDKL